MRLSWNEVRVRAAAFADKWREAAYEKGETQSFYNDFFRIFGVERRTVARYEAHVAKLDDRRGFIDLFWPGVLIVGVSCKTSEPTGFSSGMGMTLAGTGQPS